jgi:DNA-binding transcriptional MerR regulator
VGPRAIADAAGVSTDTLRHYERMGLLPAAARTDAGYRRYRPSTIDRVRVIRRALAVGFSLRELASVLRRREHGEPPCRHVRALVGERLAELERRLSDLAALRDDMRVLIDAWDARLAQTAPGQRARLLDMLVSRPSLDRSRVKTIKSER